MSTPIMDRPIYTFTKYLYVFFITNFYFLLSNILFVVAFFLADFTIQNVLLFYVVLIPMGPSITALLSTMNILVKERDVNPTKEFWKAYKENYGTSMKYWLLQLTMMLIFIVDIYYANSFISLFSPIFLVLLITSIFVMMYAFPIITKFEVKIKNLFIVSIYSNFKFFKVTLLNASSVVAFGVILYLLPGISSLFFTSLIGFFIMYNLQGSFKILANEMSSK